MGAKLTPASRGAAAGFSLIELLVVIAVLAVLSLGAVLAVGQGGGGVRAGASDMARFAETFATQRALAIQGRARRGLVVQGAGLQTARPGPEGGWVRSESLRPWRGRVVFQAGAEAFEPGGPDIRFLPNGRTSAFSIGFAAGGRCESDGWRELACDEG